MQDVQELNDPDRVRHLHGLVDKLNDTQTQMTGMKPKDAIKLTQVPLVNRENYPEEETLPEDGLYRYLLQPGEEHDNQRKRAMDRIWSKKTYRLREIMEDHSNRVMYYLKDEPERAFVKEELMLIPEDTELPLIMFRSGNIYPTGIDITHELSSSFQPHCSDVLSES